MQIYSIQTGKESISDRPRAIALGMFDGMHIGHLAVISNTKDTGGLVSSVLTFNQEAIFTPKQTDFLSSKKEKYLFLERTGVEEVFDFDFELIQNFTPAQFVKTILKEMLHCKRICCGENTRFGAGGVGTIETLKSLCAEEKIDVVITPTVYCDSHPVSSSMIRQYLQEGNVECANRMLGHNFTLSSTVEEGNHIGTTLGFPTINQSCTPSVLLPKFGVYQTSVELDGAVYTGITNIGIKPTVNGTTPLWETWIPGFSSDVYGQSVTTRLVRFLRPERTFASLDDLKTQIQKDYEAVQKASSVSHTIKAILFDFDETLQDRSIAFRKYATRFVHSHFPSLSDKEKEERIEEMWRLNGDGHAYTGSNTYIPYPVYFQTLKDTWNWTDAPATEQLIDEVQEILPSETTLFPGAIELLTELRRRHILIGVITNGYSEMQNRKLAVSGIRPLLDVTIVSGDEGIRKPDGRLFERAASRLGVAPEDCLYVGDHPYYDIQGALNGHMQPIYLDYFHRKAVDPSIPTITYPLDVLTILEER